ncbi:MAG TPA: prenyltransferase [Syntrophales bacterium]|nr:prenyltransferase [Syntrophales bacterium]
MDKRKSADAGDTNIIRIWFRAVRFHYVPPSILPAVLCSLIAWKRSQAMDAVAFALVVLGVTLNHFGINMLNDACDFRNRVDLPDREKNPYTGGSGILAEGFLSPGALAAASALCFLATAAIGIYLALTKGWPVLAIGLFGLFCSIFYTAPPVKFGYRGFGEAALLVNFGPTIGLGAYYVQTGTFSFEAFLISLVLGFMMWSMIILNEIPDYEDDRNGNKWNLVARFGRKKAITFFVCGLAASYGILIAAALFGVAPASILLALAGVPLALKTIRLLKKHYLDAMRLAPANLSMIRVHLFTGIALIAAYAIFA